MMWNKIPVSIALALAWTFLRADQAAAAASKSSCTPATFAALKGTDTIPGANVIDVQANVLENYVSEAQIPYHVTATVTACEVKLIYENPGTNSSRVTITNWLPLRQEDWNGRFLGNGGGGWMCTMGVPIMNVPIQNGFATATTDGGLFGAPFETDYTLLSPGNADKFKLERLGHRAIHEMTVGAKRVVEAFFGKQASNNYYVGCSTGGRQALMEAARYPDDYDGLLVGAPAVNINTFSMALLAEHAWMHRFNYVPSPCELDVIRRAAIERCDGLDGRTDGIIARQDLCKFTAQAAVGRKYLDTCSAGDAVVKEVTAEAARLVQLATDGAFSTNGRKLGAGFPLGTNLTFPLSVLTSHLDEKTGVRTPIYFPFSRQYAEDYLFGGMMPLPWSQVTVDHLAQWQNELKLQYDGIMEPLDDLTPFKQRGGKIILYHGEEDGIIPVGNTYTKLERIISATYPSLDYQAGQESLQEFMRAYVIPGMAHCIPLQDRAGLVAKVGGRAVSQLIAWVEAGAAPDQLLTDGTEQRGLQSVCPWPTQPVWTENGEQLTCIQNTASFFGRLPRLLEIPIKFMEHLPHWLLLRTHKLPGEL
jgi:feruloyl esterase